MCDKEEREIETDAGDNKTRIINVDTDNDTNAGAGKHSQVVNFSEVGTYELPCEKLRSDQSRVCIEGRLRLRLI